MTDSERLDWIENEIRKNGLFSANRYVMHLIEGFSCSSQHISKHPDLRSMIDSMINTARILDGVNGFKR